MPTALATLGTLFGVIAGFFFLAAEKMQVGVQSDATPAGFDGVANFQLMQIQSINFQIAIGAGIIAALFFCAAAITSRLPPPPSE
jgi:hypothetical protein